MVRILFVSGFNTHPKEQKGVDIYSSFRVFFKFSKYKVDYFRYKTTEELFDVYKRLGDILDTKKHALIITHSMGSCLTMKYINEHQCKRPYIMCMPFIHTSVITKLVCSIPMLKYLHLPKFCLIPNHNLIDGGNIFNDESKLICWKQVHSSVSDFFIADDKLVETINANNIHILYARNEFISPIYSSVLSQINPEQISYVKGKHVSFSNCYQMRHFFDILTDTMKRSI